MKYKDLLGDIHEFTFDTELKKKWLEALRSRKYKQGTGALKRVENGKALHCCLGVLAEVMGYKSVQCAGTDIVDMFSPEGVRNAGVLSENVMPAEIQSILTDKNDQYEQKFYQIARWIERNL